MIRGCGYECAWVLALIIVTRVTEVSDNGGQLLIRHSKNSGEMKGLDN